MRILFCDFSNPEVAPLPFFLNYTAPTEIYTLSLHDALPIYSVTSSVSVRSGRPRIFVRTAIRTPGPDRKSTRLNSSHQIISYAVFCLKKKTATCRWCDE